MLFVVVGSDGLIVLVSLVVVGGGTVMVAVAEPVAGVMVYGGCNGEFSWHWTLDVEEQLIKCRESLRIYSDVDQGAGEACQYSSWFLCKMGSCTCH